MKQEIYYFAYGSNIKQQRLEYRVGQVEYIRNYVLEGWKLLFNCGGFANIEPAVGQSVEGVLYKLTPIQLGELDRYEGLYYKEFFEIDGVLTAVYVGTPNAIARSFWTRPSRDYINIILEGMEEKDLIDSYNDLIDLKEQLFVLTKPAKFKKKLKPARRIR